MRGMWLVLGLSAVFASGSAIAAVVTNPDWLTKPNAEMLYDYYPDEAVDRSVSGRVTLTCAVAVNTRLEDCAVDREWPVGMGFGDAALRMATAEFRMKPKLVDGKPVAGAAVRIPLVFTAPSSDARSIVTRPVWAAAPSFEDIAAAWPAEAGDLPEGRSVLRCALYGGGRLRNCTIAGQMPKGSPFGGAARQLVDKFRLSVSPEDEKKYSVSDVAISFHFFNPATPAGKAKKVVKPDWIGQIDPARIVALFPAAAAEKGITEGVGVADCLVAPDGALTDCKPAREEPAGLGFAASAVAVAGVTKMNPWTPDGRPVAGARIKLPINFNLAPEPAPQAAEAPDQ